MSGTGVWRTSTRSIGGGECVEVASWRASSRSNGSECVEVGSGPAVVAVRDTKTAGKGPVLTFSTTAWARFTSRVKADDVA